MANKVNITNNNNKVTITPQSNNNVNTNTTNTPVTVTQGATSVVQISSIGPQGQVGPAGPVGAFNAGDDVLGRNITASADVSASGIGIFNKLGVGQTTFTNWPEYAVDIQGTSPVLRIATDNLGGFANNTENASAIWLGENGNLETRGAGFMYDGLDNKLYVITSDNGSLTDFSPYNGPRRITIKESDGNVGIGTTTPNEKLEVIGNISASGTVSAQNINLGFVGSIFAQDASGNKNDFIVSNAADTALSFGDDDIQTIVRGSSMDLNAAGNITIDSVLSGSIQFQTNNTTTVAIDTIGGNITASGNISASGDISATNVSASILRISNPEHAGQLTFFQDSDNSYRLASNIGTIFDFGSTNVITTSQRIDGTRGMTIQTLKASDLIKFRDFDSNDIIVVDNSGSLTLGNASGHEPHVTINTDLTASGNISASGNVIMDGARIFGTAIINGNITASGDLTFAGSQTITTVEASDDISITPQGTLNLGISNADSIKIGRNNDSGTPTAGRVEIFANSSTIAALFATESITFNHPVTASGDISASGDIRATSFIASGSNGTNDNPAGFIFPNPNDSTDLISNRITLTSAQNMQFRAGGVFQFANGNIQILAGNKLGFKNTDNTSNMHIVNSAGSGTGNARIDFVTSSTNLMAISASGNVGIGTTTPGEKLTVEGNISSSGEISAVSASFSTLDTEIVQPVLASQGLKVIGGNNLELITLSNNIKFRPGNVQKHTFFDSGKIRFNSAISGVEPTSTIDIVGSVSASSTGSFKHLKLDYDTMPTSDPNIKGVVYRNGSNQLFISAG